MRGRQRNEKEGESKRGRQGNALAHAHINRHYNTNEFVHYLVKSGVADPAEVSPLHLAQSQM